MNKYKKQLKFSPRPANEQVCEPMPPWKCVWVYERPLLGRVDVDDVMKVKFGVSNVAMVSWVDRRERDPLRGHWTSATELLPPQPLLLAVTLKFL